LRLENDQYFGKDKRRAAEDVLSKKIKPVPFQVVLYGATEHGFSLQTTFSDSRKKFAKEAAFSQAVQWLDQWL
jgi:dienelactone hydrolase